MDLHIHPDEARKGVEVFFFLKPKDSVPLVRTKVIMCDSDERYRYYMNAEGIDEWMPIYHFRKANPKLESYGSQVTSPLDDLHARTGN